MTQEVKILSLLGGITLVILLVGIIFLSKTQPGVTTPSVVGQDMQTLLVKPDSHKTTESPTKVTIVEFADFQCPVCATSFPIIESIKNKYKDQITFVYRYFPLPQHPFAKETAYAAEAAGKQGKFWEMNKLLFTKQNEWTEKSSITDTLVSYATELGLNIETFTADMKSEAVAKRVDEDLVDGTSLGVNATPTFYINGEKLVGVPNESELIKRIDSLLK